MISNNNFNKAILPEEIETWNQIESIILKTMALYNFKEYRPPFFVMKKLLENTFQNFSPDSSDPDSIDEKVFVVDKDFCLRPEGTIICLDEFKDYVSDDELTRLFYVGQMFRKSNTTEYNGQFTQFGAEILGSTSTIMDVEVILLGLRIFQNLGFDDIQVEIDSYGCQQCKKHNFLVGLTGTDNNGNKIEKPFLTNTGLCLRCNEKLAYVKKCFSNLSIPYNRNQLLKRNYNYYNETVFNYFIERNNEKINLGGGGRYDLLASSVVGKYLPAIGFSANLNLVYKLIPHEKKNNGKEEFTVYVFTDSQDLEIIMLQVIQELHNSNINCLLGNTGANINNDKHFDIAKKTNSNVILYINEKDITHGKLTLFNFIKKKEDVIFLKDVIDNLLRIKKAYIP